jgi:hypothetical protein
MTATDHAEPFVGRTADDDAFVVLPGTPDEARPPHHHQVLAFGVAAAVVVGAGTWLAVHAATTSPPPAASVAALERAQAPEDELVAEDVDRLGVDPASTRLLVTTDEGQHFVARSPSGELCLLRVPAGDVPTESCVPDRVGADTTIGDVDTGQVRLVADGGAEPAAADGWVPDGPNVWTR